MSTNEPTKIAIFQGKQIRRVLVDDEWWFSVIDIIAFLTDSKNPRDYWHKMKIREKDTSGNQLSTICRQLKLQSSDGKNYETDCANTEGIFRIIQSIPSPKAEPFKVWLARVGKERIDEIENPELGIDRVKKIYEQKGYGKDWVDKRIRGIAVRQGLTDEWSARGVKRPIEYAILTNDIMQGAFDLKAHEYKNIKGLAGENLRDHMTDLELIITMLGEATTSQLTQQKNSHGMSKLRNDAKIGGAVAGRTRKDIEKQLGETIVSKENFLPDKNQNTLIE
ncbi:MAG TPA: Bro-N domain-containing protein [Candidatus Dependentiae bacterium]|nr:Bro-N domain-containing protein [Candidatus Dependentiae bacterium]HRQ63192.1 Bro-N domain-containing protein [Candidatus Dependentiae bacterium]